MKDKDWGEDWIWEELEQAEKEWQEIPERIRRLFE